MNRPVFFGTVLTVLALFSPESGAKTPNPFGVRNPPVVFTKDLDDLIVRPVKLDDLPNQTFKVRHVGEPGQPRREDLLVLFTSFQAQYALDPTGKIVAAPPWKEHGLVEISVTLRQEPQNDLYLLGADAAHCVFLKPAQSPAWKVGEKIQLLAYQSGLQQWSLAGDSDTVQKTPVYEPVTLPLAVISADAPTRDQFLAALRAGETFTVLVPGKDPTPGQPRLVVQKLVW